jgi:hypothetical protein
VHPNEKARRRDPRLFEYEPLPCPDDKKVRPAGCSVGAWIVVSSRYVAWLLGGVVAAAAAVPYGLEVIVPVGLLLFGW